ncbi:hypothetical protein H0I76_09640 [Limibaculum sp. M0105]|uniref:Cytochrome c domain-containing protein n=1 Tax=Thermohalobaculum xanthum TaxID=2753746 RepID=A0A8J7M867_9RHOB|nr:hypothetical protein [Thermohalobaculum xanthum]MBK0399453.1 hypothetical protein [Thermohalobaculum xanthum]
MIGGLLLGALGDAGPRAADFHEIWEARCIACHGHAGDFVRERLTLEGDTVQGRDGRDIVPFLKRHRGGLSDAEVDLFVQVMSRQIAADGFYARECRKCHDSARNLARLRLALRNGQLVGRYSGRDIGAFLATHARMTPDEAAAMTEALAAILQGGR